jgi:hypothetical protein
MTSAKRHRVAYKPPFELKPEDPLREKLAEVRSLTVDVVSTMKRQAERRARWGDLEEAGSLRTEAHQITEAANKLFTASRQEIMR